MTVQFLPGTYQRGTYLRYDTAVILKRFYLCEQALVIGQAGWLPGIADFDLKTILPKLLWEDAMTANALRERVYELRFPSRMLEIGSDQALVDLIRSSYHAPNALGFLMVMGNILKPALKQAYEAYLALADEIGDGPTYRFMKLAIEEKERQLILLAGFIQKGIAAEDMETVTKAQEWVEQLTIALYALGGIALEAPNNAKTPEVVNAREAFVPVEIPARDRRFQQVRFYWPDIVDSAFTYGSGVHLQLRSAVSHLNEVWAIENAGIILYEFAQELGWEFVYDAARWVYDESRHCRMGYERLKAWGFGEEELPVGTYIIDSCRGQDPIYRLGMLFYFESKNIGKKLDRIKSFASMNDRVSQHDMDFDWADETIHTSYGKKWLSAILANRQQDPDDYTEVRNTCERIVEDMLQTVTSAEIETIRSIAGHMIDKAERAVSL